MALSTVGSVHLHIVHVLLLLLVLVSVSSRVLVRGQVGLCNATGCSCTESYECCLEVSEEIQNAVAGNATIHPDFGISGLQPDDVFVVVDSSLLTIDRVSGVITTNGAIDREGLPQNRQDCILLEVVLQTSGGQIDHTFAVNINDINDNSPEFPSQRYEFTVDESEAKPDLVCDSSLQAVDEDIGSVTYRVISPSSNFTIDRATDTNEVCISSHIDLDRDSSQQPSVSLTIEARDQGDNFNTATVVLMIADINDNAPVFANKSVMLKVPESQKQDSVIMQLEATDDDVDEANRMIQYSLIPEQDAFRIDPVTGDLLLTENLDYETADMLLFNFTVWAVDMGDNLKNDSSVVTIIVQDVNEMASQRSLTTTTIIEETTPSNDSVNIVSLIILDQDSPANNNNSLNFLVGDEYFSYTHQKFDPPGFFSDIFYVHQSVPIDREEQSVIELSMELVEGGNPELRRTINLTIDILDINDNRPELNQNFFQLLENSPSSTEIVQVLTIATDRDEGENGKVVEFKLISVNGCSNTTEESCTGKDLTRNFNNILGDFKTNGLLVAPNLDREEDGPYLRILLELTDGGNLSATHSLTLELLDVNDESPTFQPDSYKFSLLEEHSQIIGSVIAVDSDNGSNGTISYALTEPSSDFRINETTGEISNLRGFDRETTPTFTISVTAEDNGDPPNSATNTAEVVIEITDINDNVPTFDSQQSTTFIISADADVGERVGQVSADDIDLEENAEVFYRIEPSVFFTVSNGSPGYITVAQPLTNREESFSLTVTAFNAGQGGNSLSITITVTMASSTGVPLEVIIAVAAGGTVLIIAIVIVSICILFFYRKNRKGKLEFASPDGSLNNGRPGSPKGILVQIPNPAQRKGSGRVAFDEKVQKMVYDHKQSVTCDEAVYKVESNTNFGSGDESSPRVHHNGNIPSEGQPLTNGIPPSLYSHHTRQRSPIMLQEEEVGHPELSESTIDGHSHFPYDANSDEESTLSDDDDASNMNVQIPRFRSPEEHATNLSSSIRYTNTYQHQQHHPASPLHLVGPIPSIEYHDSLQHTYQPPLSDHSLTLTPPHSPHNHNIPSPAHPISSLGCASTAPGSFIPALNGKNRSNYPMVMPSAFSRGTPDVHMFEDSYMGPSYSDYDTSTYASSELDEALNFHPEMEPGNYSLTDVYSGDEDTEL